MSPDRVANPNDLTPLQVTVLRQISDREACDGWIAARLVRHHGTIAKRRLELQRAGLVRPLVIDGVTQVQNTPWNAPAVIHQITPKGVRALARHDKRNTRTWQAAA